MQIIPELYHTVLEFTLTAIHNSCLSPLLSVGNIKNHILVIILLTEEYSVKVTNPVNSSCLHFQHKLF